MVDMNFVVKIIVNRCLKKTISMVDLNFVAKIIVNR